MTSATDSPPRSSDGPAVRIARVDPELRRALGLFSMLVVVMGFAATGIRPLADPDLGWHLRTGELILHSGFVRSDPWSFASSRPWVLHEWGGEVVMYLAYQAGGYHGLIVLRVLLMLVLATLVIRACRQEAGPAITCLVAALAFESLWPRATERPQLISFCILAAVLPSLRRAIDRRQPPWWLIPVTYLWANIHALWPVGLMLYGALVLGLVIETGFRDWRTYRPFLLVGVASGLVVTATPNGPALLSIFKLGGAQFIGEFGAPNILSLINFSTVALGLAIICSWTLSPRQPQPTEVTFVLAAGLIGSMYNRSVPVAAIALAPIAARALSAWFRSPASQSRLPLRDWVAASVLVAIFLVAGSTLLAHGPQLGSDSTIRASRDLDRLPGKARVLNEYVTGGWLLWTARDTSPAIDGRSEVYGLPYVTAYLNALRLGPGWKQWVRSSDFDAAWLYKATPLVYGLRTMGWTTYKNEGNSVILVPPRS
jgi:hypothetical protein